MRAFRGESSQSFMCLSLLAPYLLFMRMIAVIHKYKEKDPDQDMLKAFRCFDEDGTGKISVRMFPETLCSFPNIKQCHIRPSCTKISQRYKFPHVVGYAVVAEELAQDNKGPW